MMAKMLTQKTPPALKECDDSRFPFNHCHLTQPCDSFDQIGGLFFKWENLLESNLT